MIKEPWYARIKKGLTSDPEATHYKAMGSALWLYVHLHAIKDWETEELKRKVETLSKEMGRPKRTIEHWLKRLKDEGYIEIRRGRASLNIKIVRNPGKTRTANNGGTQNNGDDQTANNGGTQPPNMAELVPKNGKLNGRKIKGKDNQTANNGGTIKTPLIKTPLYIQVFQFWNAQKITVHREPEKFKSCINARLEYYTVEELCRGIKIYADILNSQDHFFSYRWSLSDFLTRKNGLDQFIDREVAFENFRKNGSSVSPPEPPEETEEEKEERRKRQDVIFEANAKRLESTR